MRFLLAAKMVVVGMITGVVLIALMMVNGVVSDRKHYREEAVRSIQESSAGPQTIIGPVLIRPYIQTTVTMDDDGKGGKKRTEHVTNGMATWFPHTLNLQGKLAPSERRHGLYKVTVYESALHLAGSVEVSLPLIKGAVEWGEPYLAMSVSDVRGIVGSPKVTVNGTRETMLHGGASNLNWQPNLRILLGGLKQADGQFEFAIDMDIAGTERLSVAPAADSNHFELNSPWPSPLFAGQFLPRTREVGSNGFTAAWDISSLATGTQAQMQSGDKPIDIVNVSLLTPIDPYKLSDRATKYGALFVTLTFAGFFLFEMLKELRIHPMQYLLAGFGLAIFFLLLVSFSEYMAFAMAYLIASVACIGLLTFYLSYVLRGASRGLGFGAMLTAFYAAVYGLLVSEDNALVLGSLLMFVVLAVVMVVTRKVDWYKRKDVGSAPAVSVGGNG